MYVYRKCGIHCFIICYQCCYVLYCSFSMWRQHKQHGGQERDNIKPLLPETLPAIPHVPFHLSRGGAREGAAEVRAL